jgi:hypothetical protein
VQILFFVAFRVNFVFFVAFRVNFVFFCRISCKSEDSDLVRFSFQLDLVALHDLLDGGADVAQPHVDAGLADAGLGGLHVADILKWWKSPG